MAFLVIGLFGTWLVEDTAAIAEDELERRRLEHELLAAIEHGQLRLRYQAVVSLTSGATVGVEALVRWEHPTHGLLRAGAPWQRTRADLCRAA